MMLTPWQRQCRAFWWPLAFDRFYAERRKVGDGRLEALRQAWRRTHLYVWGYLRWPVP